ncbi:MAG: nitrogen regulation protein NR(II) [Betaproteobacteria bacterium]|nr:nitrogen regulation protein NR(II) [Betaproteobacteria bacterium]
MTRPATSRAFAGLDLLATSVMVLDSKLRLLYVNPATEDLLAHGGRSLIGQRLGALLTNVEGFESRLREALAEERGFWDQNLNLSRPAHETLYLNCLVTPVELPERGLMLELRPIEQRIRAEREEHQLTQHLANRELMRNLAHEIRNPLGGLRGSAQLLERELDRPELKEYTQVIIKEADRLQALMDRLLTPHRPPHTVTMNIHEVCERVRSLILAEYPSGLSMRRDYDTSIPEFQGDREQLIQAVLNVTRNAAQALQGAGGIQGGAEIRLSTRVVRQVTVAKRRYRLALELRVIDNGPGIPEPIKDTLFFPLVSGREGGSGLGLTLAQTFVQHHHGVIECDSQPGRTAFRILLPIEPASAGA